MQNSYKLKLEEINSMIMLKHTMPTRKKGGKRISKFFFMWN